jgi:DNA-directed RNA polymerase specialized sigma24 family protein
MESVKLKHYARPDMVSDPEWEQAMVVAVKYIQKKLTGKTYGGAFDEGVFDRPAAEHFVFEAFDKLYSGEWKWCPHRAVHTQLIRIAFSDMHHHLRNWRKNGSPPEIVKIDERMADHLAEDEDFMDVVYEIAERAANGDKDLQDYLKAMRRSDNYELIAEDLGITIQEVYQRQRKLLRRLKKAK